MKKVVVLPYSEYEKMNAQSLTQTDHPATSLTQQPVPTALYEPKIEKITSIERELGEILNSRMNVYEKRQRYQEVLQTLLDFKDKYTEEEKSKTYRNMKNEEEEDEQGDNIPKKDFKNILATSLPSTVKNKGLALYDTLKDQIRWDESGQIIIDGETIIGSNIVDLISDLVRNWKRNPVTGWTVIKQKLRTINFPKSLILNQNRLTDIENYFASPKAIGYSETPSRSTYVHKPTQRTLRKKKPYPDNRKLRKKISLETKWMTL